MPSDPGPAPESADSQEPDGRRWGLPDALLGYFAGVVSGSLATSTWVVATGSRETSLGLIAAGLVGLWSGYLVAIWVVVRWKGTGNVVADLRLRVDGIRDVALGVAAGLGASVVLLPVLYGLLFSSGLFDEGDLESLSDPAERVTNVARGPGYLVLFLLVGVGAPVVEECFFRGFLQPAAVRRLGPVAGIAATSVAFAAAHFQALQFPGLLALGLVVGVLAHRTGRLGPSISAHVAFNGLTLALLAGR